MNNNSVQSISFNPFSASSFPPLTEAYNSSGTKQKSPDSTGKQQLIQQCMASISPSPSSPTLLSKKEKKKVENLTHTVQALQQKHSSASLAASDTQDTLNKEIELSSEATLFTNTPSELPQFIITEFENDDDLNQSFHNEEMVEFTENASDEHLLDESFASQDEREDAAQHLSPPTFTSAASRATTENASDEHPLDKPFASQDEREDTAQHHLSPPTFTSATSRATSEEHLSSHHKLTVSTPSSTKVGSISIEPNPVELTQEDISTFITSLKDHLCTIAGFRASVSQENSLYENIIKQFSTVHELQDELRKDCETTQKTYRQIVEYDKRVSELFTTKNTALQERLILKSTEEAVLKAIIVGVNNLKDSGVGLYERYGAEWRLWELTATPGWLSSGGFLNIRKKTLGITDETQATPAPTNDDETKATPVTSLHSDDAYLQQIEKLLVDMAILKEEILIWNQAFYAVQNLLRDHDILKKITEYHYQQLKTHEEQLVKLKLLKGPLHERLTEDLKLETLPGSPSHQNASRRLVQLDECWKMIDNRQERGGKFLSERINHFKLDKKLEKTELVDKEPLDKKLEKTELLDKKLEKDDPSKVFADFSTKFTTAFSLIREIVALKEQVTLENQWENYFDPEKRKTLYFNSVNSCKELQQQHEVCKTKVLPEVETALKIEKHLVIEKMRGLKSAIEENMKKLEQDMTQRSHWDWRLSSKV